VSSKSPNGNDKNEVPKLREEETRRVRSKHSKHFWDEEKPTRFGGKTLEKSYKGGWNRRRGWGLRGGDQGAHREGGELQREE